MTTKENSGACPLCEGTGWVLEDVKGRALARRCKCYFDRRMDNLLNRANIPKRYQNCSFANFEIHKDNRSHVDALKLSKKFVSDYPGLNVGLLYIGACGVGKTHLAVAVIRELVLKKRVFAMFYDFRDLIREIQSTFSPDATLTETGILEPVFESEVLVLDELGAKRPSAWVEETVFYIINHRYNHKKLTIFTSNYLDTADEEDTRQPMFKKSEMNKTGDDTLVDRIGYRLRSRIYEMCKVVDMVGDDYRKEHKQAGYKF